MRFKAAFAKTTRAQGARAVRPARGTKTGHELCNAAFIRAIIYAREPRPCISLLFQMMNARGLPPPVTCVCPPRLTNIYAAITRRVANELNVATFPPLFRMRSRKSIYSEDLSGKLETCSNRRSSFLAHQIDRARLRVFRAKKHTGVPLDDDASHSLTPRQKA